MIQHKDLGDTSFSRSRLLYLKIQSGEIALAGNKKLKIYGLLNCKAGRRMITLNRVFFGNSKEAIILGYRPCAVCMREEYLIWKARLISKTVVL